MFLRTNKMHKAQAGFSLIEIMVGLVIGLIATLVILQVFSTFEGQKRTTTGSADAQTNGSIALFTMGRDVQTAGFGLPVFDTQNTPLHCNPSPTFDPDNNAATANSFDMFPIQIVDGGVGLSDTIRVRYAIDGATTKGGIASKILNVSGSSNTVSVANNFGCNNNDVVLLSSGGVCAMTRVSDTDLSDGTDITLLSTTSAAAGGSISCMGDWRQYTYSVVNNQLQRNDASSATATPIVSEVVNLQAQYGISADPKINQISAWVDATGVWAAPGVTSATCDATHANRNCIKAIHVAVVARNGLLEKTNVTAAAPVAWTAPAGAPTIDVSTGNAQWQQYRYRTYDTIIPLRNMIWSFNTL